MTQKNYGYLSYSWEKMYTFVEHTVCLVTCLCACIYVAYSVLSLCFVVSYSVFLNWRFSVKFSGKREISRHLLGVIIINDNSSDKDHWSMWKHWFKWVCTQKVKEKHIGKWERLWFKCLKAIQRHQWLQCWIFILEWVLNPLNHYFFAFLKLLHRKIQHLPRKAGETQTNIAWAISILVLVFFLTRL